ncbi:hypothetical protein PROFUN_01926 [Planoprotostelium fungivorum]|uniref:Uncharacterized protein n=1 Tax=Planoprotostelium fungivorum TaxID=1890364 RepID=A0A2P6NZ23_9EUKA|nr:hypothetical protein PROFUN_01926 [Planoprotostelium fungivorum]
MDGPISCTSSLTRAETRVGQKPCKEHLSTSYIDAQERDAGEPRDLSTRLVQIAWDPGSIPGRGALLPVVTCTGYLEPFCTLSTVITRFLDNFRAILGK